MAGAVSIRAAEPAAPERDTGYLEELTAESLAHRLRQSLKDTDQGVPDDSRSTLPGFQPKVLARKTIDGWAQPHWNTHSTHILKPQVAHRATRLIDEHYGHLLANHAGLANFTSELCEANGVTFLAIEPFDRRIGDDGAVTLIHQEDAAQALRLDWRTADARFQDWNWVDNPARASAARVAELLASIPGGSAHAKNITLLHTEKGTSLAPAYDTVPNLYQRDLIDEGFRLAFAVHGSFDHRRGSVDSITSEVESWRVMAPSRARPLVQAAVQMCADAIRHVTPPDGISDGLADTLNWTADQLVAGSEIGTSPWQTGAPRT
jgi:serine/threonine-protein kinase HipA